jgi:hypothetical protein
MSWRSQLSRSVFKLEFWAHPSDVPQMEYVASSLFVFSRSPSTLLPDNVVCSKFMNTQYPFLKRLNPHLTFAFRPLQEHPSRIIATFGASHSF